MCQGITIKHSSDHLQVRFYSIYTGTVGRCDCVTEITPNYKATLESFFFFLPLFKCDIRDRN